LYILLSSSIFEKLAAPFDVLCNFKYGSNNCGLTYLISFLFPQY
jgi:hypothetical protein